MTLRKKPAACKANAASRPKCEKGCGRDAKGPYAKMFMMCFLRNARMSGTWSTGNKNARGSIGNAGNKNARGINDNAGNKNARGSNDNAGNTKKGSL